LQELVPGIFHWTAFHEGIGVDVHSHFHAASGTLFDPMEPAEGVGWFERTGHVPQRIVLSNRHHWRHAERFLERFPVPVLCHERGLHAFSDGREVQGFAFGDELAPGVVAHAVGVLTPEETAVRVDAGDGALLFADSVIRGPHGDLGFVPDELLGEDSQAIKQGLRAAFRRLAQEAPFDTLLLAHGRPVPTGARSMLRTFADAPTAGAPPG
jgi:hypothetical protein